VLEESLAHNPFAIVPHRPTYLLPLTYVDAPNEAPYSNLDQELDNVEIKYQISFKIPVAKGLLGGSERFYFGYTQVSLWQAYNHDISTAFRETNYEPELLFSFVHNRELLGMRSRVFSFGVSHQSNGQGGDLSRSWNRVVANLILERGDIYVSFRPWMRIPERAKKSPTDFRGDDNPDIEDYMGNFELRTLYTKGRETYGVMLRNNLQAENRGAIEIDYTYPLGEQVRGYVQYFDGYGESLIDYNERTRRIGIGIALTNWL
jgi:phospholipase A1